MCIERNPLNKTISLIKVLKNMPLDKPYKPKELQSIIKWTELKTVYRYLHLFYDASLMINKIDLILKNKLEFTDKPSNTLVNLERQINLLICLKEFRFAIKFSDLWRAELLIPSIQESNSQIIRYDLNKLVSVNLVNKSDTAAYSLSKQALELFFLD